MFITIVTKCYYTCDLYYICDQLLHLCLQQGAYSNKYGYLLGIQKDDGIGKNPLVESINCCKSCDVAR